ncbi:MAG TPA: hypothetical protein VM901_06765 [Bdellovibrionota bacterium]|nr:hypothetical protein [Bdellovibrionota bacterium]
MLPFSSADETKAKSLTKQLNALDKLLNQRGYPALKKRHPSYYQNLAPSQFDVLESKVNNYIQILGKAEKESLPQGENTSLFWIACKHFNLRPRNDYLNTIGHDDVIEIYSLENKQIFSSCNFWSLVSYSIEDVFLEEFWDLYHRDDYVNQQIFERLQKTLQENETTFFAMDDHVMEETKSPNKHKFLMNIHAVSPLYDRNTNQIAAYSGLLRARRI